MFSQPSLWKIVFILPLKSILKILLCVAAMAKVLYIFGQVHSWGIKSVTIAQADGFGQRSTHRSIMSQINVIGLLWLLASLFVLPYHSFAWVVEIPVDCFSLCFRVVCIQMCCAVT
jgi:hypothetical protein